MQLVSAKINDRREVYGFAKAYYSEPLGASVSVAIKLYHAMREQQALTIANAAWATKANTGITR